MKLKNIDKEYIAQMIEEYFTDMEITDPAKKREFIQDLKEYKAGEMCRNSWSMQDLVSKIFCDIGYEIRFVPKKVDLSADELTKMHKEITG